MSPLGSFFSLEEPEALGRALGMVLCCSGLGEGHVVHMWLLLPFCCSLSYLCGGGEWGAAASLCSQDSLSGVLPMIVVSCSSCKGE